MRRVLQWVLLGLIWSLMAAFSWAYVAQHVQQQNQVRAQHIQQQSLNLLWDLSHINQLVTTFQSDWQMDASALRSVGHEPAISMQLAGQYMDPGLQGLLTIKTADKLPVDGHFRIEFSDQTAQVYYDSGPVNGSALNDVIDLRQLAWAQKHADAEAWTAHDLAWMEVPPVNALVIRFYGPAGSTWALDAIQLAQLPQTASQPIHQLPCGGQQSWFDSACWLTNQMRFHDQQVQRSGLLNQLSLASPPMPPVLWLMTTALLLVLVWLWAHPDRPIKRRGQLLAVVGLVPVGIGLLHIKWSFDLGQILYWLVPLGAVALVWTYRTHFKRPLQVGWPLLLGTVGLATVMWSLSGMHGEFLAGLPTYLVWAWVQQLLLGPVMTDHLRAELNLSDALIAGLVGVLFSVVHAPNHMLMLATLVGGMAWSYSWMRYRNLYLNAFSHALLALMYYQSMPEPWLGSARIGHFFL